MTSAKIVECANCDWRGEESETNGLPEQGIFDRVAPGEIMPAGECPSCSAVCHYATDSKKQRELSGPTERRMAALFRVLVEWYDEDESDDALDRVIARARKFVPDKKTAGWGEMNNDVRADAARTSLEVFCSEIMRGDLEDALPDFLCDAMHLCAREPEVFGEFDKVLARGRFHFDAETEEEANDE